MLASPSHSSKNFLSLFFVFIFTFIVSVIFFGINSPVESSFANGASSSGEFSFNLNIPISLALRLDSNDLQMHGSGDQFIFAKNTAFVTTNASKGYKLSISANDEFTDLVHLNFGAKKFTSISSATLKDNFTAGTWGYSLDNNSFLPIPKLSAASIIKETNTFHTGETSSDFYVGVKLDNDILSGVYQKSLIITALANPDPERTFGGITKMQEMTNDICSNETTPYPFIDNNNANSIVQNTTRTHSADKNLIPEAELIDSRDNKKYTIRKLADGNCWMINNLDLGESGQTLVLEASKSDLINSFTITNIGDPGTNWSTNNNSNQAAVVDNGDKWLVDVSQGVAENVVVLEPSDPELKLRHIGNHYSWYAATAGSGSFSTISGDAEHSICPKGWRLPFGKGGAVNKSFQKLSDTYQITQGSAIDSAVGSMKIRLKPLSFSFGGLYWGNSFIGQGNIGLFWTSTANSDNYSRYLHVGATGVSPQAIDQKMYGLSIRCVSR